jgi:hypothetical protein
VNQAELLAFIGDRLEAADIPYMVVGSVAGSFHGEPRTTVDIDIVIDPTAGALRGFVDSLPRSTFYVDENAAAEAFSRRSSFNVIDHGSGGKVDLLIRRDRPFSRTEFERRLYASVLGRDTPIATAEDTVIAKLEWAVAGESERQLRDVARILAVSGDSLDQAYLTRWLTKLGLEEAFDRAERLSRGAH